MRKYFRMIKVMSENVRQIVVLVLNDRPVLAYETV